MYITCLLNMYLYMYLIHSLPDSFRGSLVSPVITLCRPTFPVFLNHYSCSIPLNKHFNKMAPVVFLKGYSWQRKDEKINFVLYKEIQCISIYIWCICTCFLQEPVFLSLNITSPSSNDLCNCRQTSIQGNSYNGAYVHVHIRILT